MLSVVSASIIARFGAEVLNRKPEVHKLQSIVNSHDEDRFPGCIGCLGCIHIT